MSTPHKIIYRFNAILIKIPMAYFVEAVKKKKSNICMETQKPSKRQSLNNNKKRKEVLDITSLNFKIYHKAAVIKMAQNWHKKTKRIK